MQHEREIPTLCRLFTFWEQLGRLVMGKVVDLTGQRFGRLTVIRRSGTGKNRQSQWFCKCDCGADVFALSHNLISGNTKSCGCLRVDMAKEQHTKHGFKHHPLYEVWKNMLSRCYNTMNPSFRYYGGRGVFVCDEWKGDPSCFIGWSVSHGWKPGLQLDRINNSKGYSPGNCHFVTPRDNINNRRCTRYIEGEPASVWFEKQNHHPSVNYKCFCYRFFRRNWDLDRSLLTPNRYLFMEVQKCRRVSYTVLTLLL